MKGKFRSIKSAVLLATAFLTPLCFWGITLPTKTIQGKEYYYYQVKPKETIYGICKEIGLTKAQVVKYNPSVADGLRTGAILYFPVEVLDNVTPQEKSTGNKVTPVIESSESENAVPESAGQGVHLVEKGETIYGISRQYGMTQDELIALNPSIAYGLKAGMVIHVKGSPESESDVPEQTSTTVPVVVEPETVVAEKEAEQEEPDVEEPQPVYVSSVADEKPVTESRPEESEAVETDVVVEDEDDDNAIENDTVNVAVMLPFLLSQTTPDKQAQLYTEFYKGILLAADSLRNSSRNIVISAYDTCDNLDSLMAVLNSEEVADVDVIIAPDNEQQLRAINTFAVDNGVIVMNIFAVKSELYKSSPAILQANIPHGEMYGAAIDGFINSTPSEYIPVFISAADGKNEKSEFIKLIKERLVSEGREYKEISYKSYLKESDLAGLDKEKWYVFVPSSGSLSEFNHIISALKNYRESLLDYNQVRMFGYPDWITFRGDALENLHLMNTTVYTRFYNDDDSYRTQDFYNRYKKWYGTSLMTAVPVQGILGFDTAFFLIKAIQRNPDNIGDQNYSYNGIQSGFHFVKPDEAEGMINDVLFFVNFRPSGIIDKRIIE